MPIPGLNPELCRLRNRRAAREAELNAVPLLFLRQGLALTLPRPAGVPDDDGEALARINQMLGRGPGLGLSADDVYIHRCEAGNDNLVPDRWMFLGESTLRNCAQDGNRGFALMNSHRTGGLSAPAELPYGRTFAGDYETVTDEGGTRKRCTLGVYMLRRNSEGEPYRPNGSGGPSSADLHAGIEGGTIFDVSLGLYGGEPICDVCGEDMRELARGGKSASWDDEPDYLCPHLPGTQVSMRAEQSHIQSTRGVPDGNCTFTLENARPGEVSPVFDGAVPGAGFRKALSLARRGRLDEPTLQLCRTAYLPVCRGRDFELRTDGAELLDLTGRSDQTSGTLIDSLLTDPEGLLAGLSLDDHARVVLAAAGVLTGRLEAVKALRAAEDRSLSAQRFTDRDRLLERLAALGTAPRSQAERLRALRARVLQTNIDRRSPVAAPVEG